MKRLSRVTSHDVAAAAGVSRSAVSRTFTPGASVSSKTRTKVIAAAEKLGYRPNVLARGLTGSSTRMIGLVMGEWENPFFTRTLRRFTERFQEDGYHLLLLTSNSEAGVDDAIRRLLGYQVDGLIAVSVNPSAAIVNSCLSSGTPLVLLNCEPEDGADVSTVNCDNHSVGRSIVHALQASGYRRFALVSGDPTLPSSARRIAGIRDAVAAASELSIIDELAGYFDYDGGRRAVSKLWKCEERPDAVICSSDPAALGLLDGARADLDIRVPEQLAVIGLGDIPQAGWQPYQLSTVHLPVEEMIDVAVTELLSRLADPDRAPAAVTTQARIVLRASVRP